MALVKNIIITWRDDSMKSTVIKSFSLDRKGDYCIKEMDGSKTYIPSSAVYSINVADLKE